MFTYLWGGLKKLGQLLVAPMAKVGGSKGFRPFLRWTLHILFVAGILVGLWYLGYVLDLERAVRSPWTVVDRFWLPLLFVLVYIMGWLIWWMTKLIGAPEQGSRFPDIDLAWNTACLAVEQAGIDMTHTPLFLVLGRPASSETTLFETAQIPLVVSRTPKEEDVALAVYANAEGVYVCCSRSSLLGEQAHLLSRKQAPVPDDDGENPASSSPPVEVQTAEGQERALARLRHLCSLIRAKREPYCPMNGLVVVLPAVATGKDTLAQETGVLLRQDLHAVRQTMQLRCPLLAIVADLQHIPGARTFLDRFPESKRSQRLGVPSPYVGDSEAHEEADRIEQSVSWICRGLIPPLVHRLLRIEGDDEDLLAGNRDLHLFLQEIRDRRSRLTDILTRGLLAERHWFFSGIFLAATGSESVLERAFLAEVMPQVVQMQNFVYWTSFALDEDTSCYRWAVVGVVLLVVFVVVMLALMVWLA